MSFLRFSDGTVCTVTHMCVVLCSHCFWVCVRMVHCVFSAYWHRVTKLTGGQLFCQLRLVYMRVWVRARDTRLC